MRLSELMSAMDLSLYPQAGLVIFLAVFAAVVVRTYAGRRSADLERLGAMPLDHASPGAPAPGPDRSLP